jgi:transposase
MASEFWLRTGSRGPVNRWFQRTSRGRARTDDRRVISGIVHVLGPAAGCRWQDCPSVCGPQTTTYNRFRRWTMRGHLRRVFQAIAYANPGEDQAIDSSTAKAHRSAAGGKGGRGAGDWPVAWRPHNDHPRHRRRARTPSK